MNRHCAMAIIAAVETFTRKKKGSKPSALGLLTPGKDRVADLAERDYHSSMTGSTGRLPMRVTALLAIVLILAFATATLGGLRQGPAWQPCDYNTDWKIDGTSCG
jgi:hypothetical protein